MKKYLETIVMMFSKETDKKTKTQNLIFLVILLVFSLILINNIFKEDTVETISKNKDKNNQKSNKNESTNYNSTEENLKNILAEISGISDVSVMITYVSNEKVTPVYDVKEDTTLEEDSNGSVSKTSKKTTTEKKVAYEEVDGKKIAILESKSNPEVMGAIIVVKGLDSEKELKIKEAVSKTLNIPIHKIEVFSK
ncbi:MAG: hypothetical protein PHR25_03675 [Clostridia bacterium]|nr:hypothetical protein [Clostridia bacterium]MDD4375861.1 hypothetical protein [Clostridia bacterium]